MKYRNATQQLTVLIARQTLVAQHPVIATSIIVVLAMMYTGLIPVTHRNQLRKIAAQVGMRMIPIAAAAMCGTLT